MSGPKADKVVSVALTLTPPEARHGRLKELGGSTDDDLNRVLVDQVAQAMWVANSDADERERQAQAMVAAMFGVAPRDELEGMLGAQLVAAHNAAMECFRRAMLKEQSFEGRGQNLGQANKLMRSYAALLEALDRHRGKGQQTVRVEHVTVQPGGQAIVGAVTAPAPGAQGGGG